MPGGETAEKTRYGPRVIGFEDLAYPPAALSAQGAQGAVVVQVTLDDQGNILNVSALSGIEAPDTGLPCQLEEMEIPIMPIDERLPSSFTISKSRKGNVTMPPAASSNVSTQTSCSSPPVQRLSLATDWRWAVLRLAIFRREYGRYPLA